MDNHTQAIQQIQSVPVQSINERYYSTTYVQFELIKQLKDRYLSIMKPQQKDNKRGILIRYLKGFNLQTLNFTMNSPRIKGWKNVIKMYHDLASFETRNMPTLPTGMDKESTTERQRLKIEIDDNFEQYCTGWDAIIDIDSGLTTWRESWRDAKKIKSIFDSYGIPYQLKWSGQKGFHFRIENKYLPLEWSPERKVEETIKMVDALIVKHNLKKVDMNVYDTRRIFKLAYSLDHEFIVLPLNDQEFTVFTPDYARIDRVLKHRTPMIARRGLLERPGNSENVIMLYKDYN